MQILRLEDYKAATGDLTNSADCVEKVGFSRILAIFDVSLVFKVLFLLEINFIALANFSRKGLFQHNRPIRDFHIFLLKG
jgi:hypothetical protein